LNEQISADTLNIRNAAFLFRQDIVAPYLQYTAGKGNWQWSAGLRVEFTANAFGTGDYGNYNQAVPVLPNLKISYQKGQKHYGYVYFTKKIRRPAYYLYNPEEQVSDRFYVFQGNPGLKPVDIWRWQTVYFYKHRYAVLFRYDYSLDNILQLTAYDDATGRTVSYPVNTGKQHQWIGLISFPLKIRKGWQTQTKIYYSYKIFKAPELSRPVISDYPGITHTHQIDLFPGGSVEINLNYTGRYNNLNNVYEPTFTASVFMFFNLWQNKLKAFVNFYDIFNSARTEYFSYLPDRTVYSYSKYNSRFIGFGLRYILRKYDEPDEYTPDRILEEEKKRAVK